MKYLFFISYLILIFSSCNSPDKNCSKLVDSLKLQLVEYQSQDKNKSELILKFDEQVQKFAKIQDSIRLREKQIDSLRIIIKKRGTATPNDNKMLNQLLSQVRIFLEKNKELAKELSINYTTTTQTQLISILLNTVADKQNQINYLQKDVEQLQKDVKGLQVDNANLVTTVNKLETINKQIKTKGEELVLSDIAITLPTNIVGGNKKAKNIDKIVICYTINANKLAKKEKKQVYIRINNPDKTTISSSDKNLFLFDGKELLYTLKQEGDYKGDNTKNCVEWTRTNQKLVAGNYNVEFFIDGLLLATKSFSLNW